MSNSSKHRGPRVRQGLSCLLAVILVAGAAAAEDESHRDAELHYAMGLFHLNAEEYELALREFEQAVDLIPTSSNYALAAGMAANGLGDSRKAIQYLEQSLEVNGELRGVHHELGRAYLGLGDLDAARRHLEEAIAIEPGRAETHLLLGVVLDRSNEPDAAAASYAEAERLDPELADDVALFRAQGYVLAGKMEEAAEQLNRASAGGNPTVERLSRQLSGGGRARRSGVLSPVRGSRWGFTAYLSETYDDNVLLDPALGPVPGGSDDFRTTLFASGRYHAVIGENGYFGVGMGAYLSHHSRLDPFDLFGIMPEVFGVYRIGPWSIQARATWQHFELDHMDYLTRTEATIRQVFRISPVTQTEVTIAYQDDDFAAAARRGHEWTFGVTQYVFPWENKRRYIAVGAEHGDRHAGNDFHRTSWSGHFTFYTPLCEPWDLLITSTYVDDNYDNVHSVFGIVREDQEWTHSIRSTYWIADWVALLLEFRYTDHGSNIPVFDYDRATGTAGLIFRN